MTAHEEAVQRHARVLKAMIWGMGLLMAAAAVVVVAMIVKAVNRPEMGDVIASLPVPAGCTITQMTTSGDRLVVALGAINGGAGSGGGPECRGILVADLATGKLIGQFKFSGE